MSSTPSDQMFEGQTLTGVAAKSLGQKLRLAREERGVSLRQISDHTRIARRYLEAIEADDYKQLPGGIFNRSFIKAYARSVGLNEREAVAAYARAANELDNPEEAPVLPYKPRVYIHGASSRSPFTTALLSILILAVLSLGIYALLDWYRKVQPGARARLQTAARIDTEPVSPPVETAAAPAVLPTPRPPAPLTVEIRAKTEPVWLRARADEDDAIDTTLQPNETKQYAPRDRLILKYSRSRASDLEVSVNGRTLQPPAAGTGPLVEAVITKSGLEQISH